MKNNHMIHIDHEKCVGCGLCRKDCPANNILLEHNKARVLAQNCIQCGHCVAICPKSAVSMTGFEEPPIEIQAPALLQSEELLAAIRTRRSIRQFTSRTVPPEVISKILEAGRLTPTGGNTQDVSFLVLADQIEPIEKTAVSFFRRLLPVVKFIKPMAKRMEIDDHFFFKKAPIALVILAGDPVNGALAASNMALMAESCGLGVLYSGFFSAAVNHSLALRRQLGLSGRDKSAITLVLGYSSVTYHRTAQKEAADIRWL